MFDFIPVAIKNFFSRPATRNYPKVKRRPYEGQRGHVTIDLPNCIYCGMCSRKCPVKAIAVNRAGREWSIDRFQCIMCGECVRSCPKKCLGYGPEYAAPAHVKAPEHFKMPPLESMPGGPLSPAKPAAPAKTDAPVPAAGNAKVTVTAAPQDVRHA